MGYRYIGRYRTPSRLGRTALTVRRRNSAVSACFRLARKLRQRAFAIRGGVQCYLSSMTFAKFTRRGKTRLGGLKVYLVSKGSISRRIRPRPRPRRPRIRPRPVPRPLRRVWNYRRIGTFRIPRDRSSPGRKYLGTINPRVNPAKQCSLMAREIRFRYFGLKGRRYCYGAYSQRPLTRYGRTTSLRGINVYKIGRGRLRPRPRASVWYYRYIGRFRSLSSRGLGQYVVRMKGKNKVYECARRANKMGYRAFALRNGGDCYVSRSKRQYSNKQRVFGRFKASSGGPRVIDAYVIGKG